LRRLGSIVFFSQGEQDFAVNAVLVVLDPWNLVERQVERATTQPLLQLGQ
jgi:hypothetical protein